MYERTNQTHLEVTDGRVPLFVADHEAPLSAPGVIVVPSIYGPNDDLLADMAGLTDLASTVVLDPFWRQGGGAIDYFDRESAVSRLDSFDRGRCRSDVVAVAAWMSDRTNRTLIGVGICFGGPFVLTGAAEGWLSAAATWHGSHLEKVLDQLEPFDAPLRLHFGDADPVTPPEAIDAVRQHFASHPDCQIRIHPGGDHGFSFHGPAWDPVAAATCLASLRELVQR